MLKAAVSRSRANALEDFRVRKSWNNIALDDTWIGYSAANPIGFQSAEATASGRTGKLLMWCCPPSQRIL